MELLTRDDFRNAVFERDDHKCVLCGAPAQDAHHIMERRLFPDGGYYLDNGTSVCGPCHLKCESTLVFTEEVRAAAGIQTTVLPPHLYSDTVYDKWGNPKTESGQWLRGELYYDHSVQKALKMRYPAPDHVFTKYVKYPRTFHVPWSPTPSDDDRVMPNTEAFEGRTVVVTEKMDGENTTMYNDYIHARSVDGRNHSSRSYVQRIHADHVAYQISPDWRICGENLYAQHSIPYNNLPSYFMVFGVWEQEVLLSWEDTEVIAGSLGLDLVPVLYFGVFDEKLMPDVDFTQSEGYVIRLADEIDARDFPTKVGKYVRPNHVQTTKHWMHGQAIIPNNLGAKNV